MTCQQTTMLFHRNIRKGLVAAPAVKNAHGYAVCYIHAVQ
jgi:hypothetical protein